MEMILSNGKEKIIQGRANEHSWKITLVIVLFLGVAARVGYYLLDDSFWRDETALLLNVAQSSFSGLLKPLIYGQESPITFLWLLRVLWVSGAQGELFMRGASLASGLAAFYFYFLLVSRIFTDHKVKLFSLLLFGLSPGIILFTGLVKQYSIDLMVASLLLYTFRSLFIDGLSIPKIPIWKYILIALSPWFSLPSLFIAISVGAGLVLKKKKKYPQHALTVVAVTCASFSLEWLLVLHRCLGMKTYINDLFFKYTTIGGWIWSYKQIFFAFHGSHFTLPLIVGILFASWLLILGIIEVRRICGLSGLAILILPILLACGASVIQVFPIMGRNLLFVTPGLFILIGYGMERIFRSHHRPIVTSILVLVFLIFPCFETTVFSFAKKEPGVREGLRFIAEHWRHGDVIICEPYSAPTIAYYRLINRPYMKGLQFTVDPEKLIELKTIPENAQTMASNVLHSSRRVWLISESNFYARESSASIFRQVSFITFMQRYIGKKQIESRFAGYALSIHLKKILDEFSSHRRLFDQYVSTHVQVYGFD
jgi:hypothetical protein